MTEIYRIDLGFPALLEFRGPDAVRFLNGQVTQDVRRVVAGGICLPSCVTDAKGRMQFRVSLTENDSALWICGLSEWAEALKARLIRYLIADDVEVVNLTGQYYLMHFTGPMAETPTGVVARQSTRFGIAGTDWWIPISLTVKFPAGVHLLDFDDLEALRIANGVPAWGRELKEGMLPPEARLDETDISYHKGCYIGQEVISRIKSAGKVNKRLVHLVFGSNVPPEARQLVDADGIAIGELTSVSPLLETAGRHALGYVKRGVIDISAIAADGVRYAAQVV